MYNIEDIENRRIEEEKKKVAKKKDEREAKKARHLASRAPQQNPPNGVPESCK